MIMIQSRQPGSIMKKRFLMTMSILAAAFLLLNSVWFGWRHFAYSDYRTGMNKTDFSSLFHLTYVGLDEDGFEYNVSYPDYLTFTGNLAVGYPGTDENPFTDGLIIWPGLFGGYEYGIILNPKEDDPQGYMFYIDPHGNAVDETYRETAEKNQAVILELLERANSRWILQ